MTDWFAKPALADFDWCLDKATGNLHRFPKKDLRDPSIEAPMPTCGGERIKRANLVYSLDPDVLLTVTCPKCLTADMEERRAHCRSAGCHPEHVWPPDAVSTPAAG